MTRKLGRVAEKENRIEDALKLYQMSLTGLPAQVLNAPEYVEVASIKGFYLAHGGTDERWLEWAGAGGKTGTLPSPTTSLNFTQPLPEFAVKDLSGRVWRLTDLLGKGTLINFWATWCGPCRGEHPEIQKLHDRLKAGSKMQVLTFSVDDDPGRVVEYIKEKGYTFPVIHSPVLANKLFPYIGLPSNVLVNASGMRTSFYGFGGGEIGLQRALKDLAIAAGDNK